MGFSPLWTHADMREAWLENNRRLLLPLSIPALLTLLVGLVCVGAGVAFGTTWIVAGAIFVAGSLLYLGMAWLYVRQPRLSCDSEQLHVHVGWNRHMTIPIDSVEVFFMGQASSLVRGADGKEAETATVVVRIAERAKDWHHRDMPPHLGQWCDGYIIVRGTWCEPIDMPLLERLNRNLAAAHRQRKQAEKAEA